MRAKRESPDEKADIDVKRGEKRLKRGTWKRERKDTGQIKERTEER